MTGLDREAIAQQVQFVTPHLESGRTTVRMVFFASFTLDWKPGSLVQPIVQRTANRKRKRQFYGNKFTNISKKNSTSAVPECTASCSKLGNDTFSTAEEMPSPVFGNRIVDLELIV
ncbi:hypothetical protein TNCV_2572641 [Trichonephila clavipes]|nr:hypothetical protein TNCV_2572641 [Trichonephila clavipes]